jgi:hypothetical protein
MDANTQSIVGGQNVIRSQTEQRDARSRPGDDRLEDGARVRDGRQSVQEGGAAQTVHTERTRAADRFGWKVRRR